MAMQHGKPRFQQHLGRTNRPLTLTLDCFQSFQKQQTSIKMPLSSGPTASSARSTLIRLARAISVSSAMPPAP